MTNENPYSKFKTLSDTEWEDVLCRSITERTLNGVTFPKFPDTSLQEQTVGGKQEEALREAFKFYQYTKEVLRRNNLPFTDTFRMVDFGTCWGRIARCFLRDVIPGNIVGLEVREEFIETFNSLEMPFGVRKVQPLGPSTLPPASIDLVTAYSVFSHLDKTASDAWAAEFFRILKPGGILVATTEGEPFLDFCTQLATKKQHDSAWHKTLSKAFPQPEEARRRYHAGQLVATEPYPTFPHYGETLIPPGYMMSAWGADFELLEFRQAGQEFWQAVFVLRRRKNPLYEM